MDDLEDLIRQVNEADFDGSDDMGEFKYVLEDITGDTPTDEILRRITRTTELEIRNLRGSHDKLYDRFLKTEQTVESTKETLDDLVQ
jgi:arsenate reductase-like glutaredoxin family protein